MKFCVALALMLFVFGSVSVHTQTGDQAVDTALELLRVDGVVQKPPRVQVVDLAKFSALGVTASHRAFVIKDKSGRIVDKTVYISSKNQLYGLALQGSSLNLILLAGTIIHENEHFSGKDVSFLCNALLLSTLLV
jgi:hypothetical protein